VFCGLAERDTFWQLQKYDNKGLKRPVLKTIGYFVEWIMAFLFH